MTRRLDLVTAANRILLENITYSEQVAVQQYARLLARELAAWVIIDVERDQRLRRQMVAGPDTQQARSWPGTVAAVDPQPGSAPFQVHESGSAMLIAHAEDAGALGDGPDGMPLLMLLGATSLLCVPLTDGERSYGVLTLAAAGGSRAFRHGRCRAGGRAGRAARAGDQDRPAVPAAAPRSPTRCRPACCPGRCGRSPAPRIAGRARGRHHRCGGRRGLLRRLPGP